MKSVTSGESGTAYVDLRILIYQLEEKQVLRKLDMMKMEIN